MISAILCSEIVPAYEPKSFKLEKFRCVAECGLCVCVCMYASVCLH